MSDLSEARVFEERGLSLKLRTHCSIESVTVQSWMNLVTGL